MPKLSTYIETQYSSQRSNWGKEPSLERYMETFRKLPDSEKVEVEGMILALGSELKKKKGTSTGLGTLGAVELFGRLAEFLVMPDFDERMKLYTEERNADQ